MNQVSEKVKFIINLAKTQSIITKHFESGLGNGLGFNEFLILFYLNQALDEKMRRVDLAEKVSLTASGVTRLLLPMEKIGLVKTDPDAKDARVRFVSISQRGKEKMEETLDRFSDLIEEMLYPIKNTDMKKLSGLLIEIGGKILMK